METSKREWRIENRVEDLTRVSREMAEWLDSRRLPGRVSYTARLAVEEIAGNTIKYGYGDAAEGTREAVVGVSEEGEYLRVDFWDDGFEFNPLLMGEVDLEGVLDGPRDGGLGLALMRRIADRMSYEREGARNHLTIWVKKRTSEDTQQMPGMD